MSLVNTRTAKPLPGVRVNPTHPYAQGLVAAYLFNESSGIRSYDVVEPGISVLEGETPPKNINVNLAGGLGYVAAELGYITSGKYATGTDKNLPAASATQPFTIMWRAIRSNSSNTCDWMYGTSGTGGAMLAARSTANNAMSFLGWSADLTATTVGGVSINNKWVIWTMTYNGVTVKIYQDGIEIGSGPLTLSTIKTGTLRFSIDTFNSGVTSLIGIDFWYAYNKALTPAVIRNMAADPFALFRTRLANYWLGAQQTITTTQTIQGKARITVTTSQTITGRARIGATTTQTVLGRARISVPATQTITGKSRITATTTQTLTGKARIRVTTTRTITGKALITNDIQRTIQGRARIQITSSQTITGRAAIAVTTTKTITGKARIGTSGSQTIQGKSRITATTTQTITGRGRIRITSSQTITGKAKIFIQTTPIDRKRVFVVNQDFGRFKVLDDIDRTFVVVTDPRVFKVL